MKKPAILRLLLDLARNWRDKEKFDGNKPIGYEAAKMFDPKLAQLMMSVKEAQEKLYQYVLDRSE